MLLFVGLGNPGTEHAMQRHNVGFMAIDAIIASHRFGPARARFNSFITEGQVGTARVIALKPQTYMNDSGAAVQPAAAFYKIPPQDIFVFHDDLDLAPGRVKVKRGGGAAGHNGLRAIDQRLGTPDYYRVRIGIGHPGHRDRVLGYVLGNFAKADQAWLAATLGAIADAAFLLTDHRAEDFMTRVAALTQGET